jgi:hypothetical protein
MQKPRLAVRVVMALLASGLLQVCSWTASILLVGSCSLSAYAAPLASSPEGVGSGEVPCDCPQGELCSSFTVPQGKDQFCFSGVCDGSCRCQPQPLNIGCAPTTRDQCVEAVYSCDQGECMATYTKLVGPKPAELCEEVTKEGVTSAVKQNWSLQLDPCAWRDTYTYFPKPADTCDLTKGRDSLIKSTAQLDRSLCGYEMVTAVGYPKYKPAECDECSADTSVSTCDWVRPSCKKPAELSNVVCRVDTHRSVGIEERSTFSVEQCRLNVTTNEVPRPNGSCVERSKGEAVLTQATQFVLTEDKKGCRWLFGETTIKGEPPSCRFDAKTGNAYRDLSELSKSCVYTVRSQEIPKPTPECFDSGFNSLVLRQAKDFDPTSGICEWNTSDTYFKKPTNGGCTVQGRSGTFTPVKIVSDMQAVPPICKWEVGAPSVVTASSDTCEYKPGISTPSETELSKMSDEQLQELTPKLGRLTYALYGIDPGTCQESKQEYFSYWPQETTCEDSATQTTWTAHNSLSLFRDGVRVERCSWVPKREACFKSPSIQFPVRGVPVGGGAVSAPAPVKPASPPPAPVAPAAPPKCNYYTVTSSNFTNSKIGLTYTAGAVQSCIQSRLTWATGECNKNNPYGTGPEYLDDCISAKIAPAASVMLNAQCQVISEPPTGAVLCSSAVYGYRASPVSLVWAVSDPASELTVSTFPLFADGDKKVVVWRASDALPLVVFDPDHREIITSREQLFGEHFRGGVRGRPWRDGYEALGSLDINGDGEVAGAELEPLALWFDSNRDGISQPGEVRRLAESGVNVTKLFFNGGVRSKDSSDINLALGFERIRGSTTERGSSVDWYTEGAESKEALINKLALLSRRAAGDVSTAPTDEGSRVAHQRVESPLNGAFVWFSTDKLFAAFPKDTPGGAMTFTEFAGGRIEGNLYVETDFAVGGPIKSQLDTISVVGTVEALADGSKRISFNPLRNATPGTEFNSTAILSQDGSTLTGDTSVALNYSGDIRRFTYSWKAAKQ